MRKNSPTFIPNKTRIVQHFRSANNSFVFYPQYQHGLWMKLFNTWNFYTQYWNEDIYKSMSEECSRYVSFYHEQDAIDYLKTCPPIRKDISKSKIICL